MHLLIAPDKFAGTLTAPQAAEAIAEGWRRVAPDDEVDLAPLSDGGPGFVGVVHAARGGDLVPVTVTGPLGDPVPALLLLDGDTAYVETAQACGLDLVPAGQRDPLRTTTRGVGEMIAAAVDAGARRIVLGLGGSATNDGGSGMLAALGASFTPHPEDVGALGDVERVDLEPARRRVAGHDLVVASDVDNPLLGIQGASVVFGPQKGAGPDCVLRLDGVLARWATLTGGDPETAGAGAAGGLGFGLGLLGATRVPGIETVLDLVSLRGRVGRCDLVLTGEGSLDASSLRGKVAAGVAAAASSSARPCLVLAGRVDVGRRELGAAGITAAYAVVDGLEDPSLAFDRPDRRLADLAASVAREWARRG